MSGRSDAATAPARLGQRERHPPRGDDCNARHCLVAAQAPQNWLTNTHRMAPAALGMTASRYFNHSGQKPVFCGGSGVSAPITCHTPPFWLIFFRPCVAVAVPHKGGWAGHPLPTRMTTPGNLIMTIVRQGLTTLLHVIGALALLASLDPTLTRLQAQSIPLKPFNPVFKGCPAPNTSTRACIRAIAP